MKKPHPSFEPYTLDDLFLSTNKHMCLPVMTFNLLKVKAKKLASCESDVPGSIVSSTDLPIKTTKCRETR